MISERGAGPGQTVTSPGGGPCGQARAEAADRCSEAERLAEAAASYQERVRQARRELVEANRERDLIAEMRDGRHLAEQKERARMAYREAVAASTGKAAAVEAAGAWLGEVDRLNRQLDEAERRTDVVYRRLADLEHRLPGIELAADAARIAAETAQAACVEARRALAACEEEARARAVVTDGTLLELAPKQPPTQPITLVLHGDRQAQLGLALRLAEETGVEAGRLQLLLIELRDQLAARALEEHVLRFSPDNPFWSQFTPGEAHEVVASLATMGYRFDGSGGWAFGRSPTAHDLALALSYCGHDPRSLRRPAGQAAIDGLWEGTQVRTEDFLAGRAPDLELGAMMALIGPGASGLSELWDMWGRLRPLLLASSAG